MNGMNRTSLLIGMLLALVGIFTGIASAQPVENESDVDATVTQVAHWQAMGPDATDSTVTQVAHWQTMSPDATDSTVTQVAHWQIMSPDAADSTVTQVAHWQAMNPDVTDSTVAQVAHWQAMAEMTAADELVFIDADAVAEVVIQR